MRIGIVPALSGFRGGVYQYSLTMLRALFEYARKGVACGDEFVVFANRMHHPVAASLVGQDWLVKPLEAFSLKRLARDVLRQVVGEDRLREAWEWYRQRFQGLINPPDPDVVRRRPHVGRWFSHFGVELMLYPSPDPLCFETGIPYVLAVHDLQHRLQPEFPEVSAHGEWELREYLFRNGTRYATLLLADSEVGREDIANLYGAYGVTPDRVKVLPFLPASYLPVDVPETEQLRLRRTYHLPERYLFYPAQFWPHKNHARIVRALGLLKAEYHLRVPIVFCGSYAGGIRKWTFREAMLLSRQLGLDEEVCYLGYVPDEDLAGLYAGAVALVMPTFFGPTNIPVLEAWAFGCPVLTSDIRGVREQAGDAAVLVDPRSVEALADGLHRLWADESLRHTLADRGRQRLATYTPKDYHRRLMEILEEAKTRALSEKPKGVRL